VFQVRRRPVAEGAKGKAAGLAFQGRVGHHRFVPPRATIPHVLPYQGSKRLLAPAIAHYLRAAGRVERLYEPFCGSAAVTLHAAHHGLAQRYVLGDSLSAVVGLWRLVAESPDTVVEHYAGLHADQGPGGVGQFEVARERFNRDRDPRDFLWLCARCVKNAVRFGANGHFNQSADRRRSGTQPRRMADQIRAAGRLLRGRTEFRAGSWLDTLADAGPRDVAYLDPPYFGTSTGGDPRYHQGLDPAQLVEGLRALGRRGVRVVLSYDGRTGDRVYGDALPAELGLVRLEVDAGRSAQATLLGRSDRTVESLYVSQALHAAARGG